MHLETKREVVAYGYDDDNAFCVRRNAVANRQADKNSAVGLLIARNTVHYSLQCMWCKLQLRTSIEAYITHSANNVVPHHAVSWVKNSRGRRQLHFSEIATDNCKFPTDREAIKVVLKILILPLRFP